MKVSTLPKEFQQALPVINLLEEAGFEAYFVGGSVRDLILDKPIHDVDIATSAYPAEVKDIFKRTIDVGIEHGTVLVLFDSEQYEITTFRTESTYQDYRRPDEVNFVRSLAEDLKRRDFTINALAMNQAGEIIDLFSGLADLEKRLIRAVGIPQERFSEDALRMMRCLRFASQLDFAIEEQTLDAISDQHQLLENISVERLQIEYVKLVMGVNRKRGLAPFITSQAYRHCPGFQDKQAELTALMNVSGPMIKSEALVWLLTLISLEIPGTACGSFLRRWKLSNQLINQVILLRKGVLYRLENNWTNEWLYALGEVNLELIEQALPYFDKIGDPQTTVERYRHLPIHSVQELAINGKDLLSLNHEQAGPWVGELISKIESAILTADIVNTRAELLTFAKKIIKEKGVWNE